MKWMIFYYKLGEFETDPTLDAIGGKLATKIESFLKIIKDQAR